MLCPIPRALDTYKTSMRRSLSLLLLLGIWIWLPGCTAATPRGSPERSLRPAAQCLAAIDSAAAGSIEVDPPRPRDIRLPPRAPDALRGQAATLTFHVDTSGKVIADRIRVTGIADQSFASRLKERAKAYSFSPATANGCAVPGSYELIFEL